MDQLNTTIEIGELIGKYLANKESEEELEQLKAWLKANPANQQLFDSIKTEKSICDSIEDFEKYQAENAWSNISTKIVAVSLRQNLLRWKIAAIFFFIVGLGSLVGYIVSGYNPNRSLSETYTTISTKYGQNSKIVLPDSSVVWINSGSELSYNNSFALSNRKLKLKGQAFFQVTKNKNMPFVVESKYLNVKVLGTRFDISAYPEDKNVEVVLEKGKVEISNNKVGLKNSDLKPGEKAEFNITSEKLKINKIDSHIYSSWKEGILIFRDERMSEVIKKLERWYNISIEVKDDRINKLTFNGTIVNEGIEEFFNLVRYSCTVNYTIIPSKDPVIPVKVILYN